LHRILVSLLALGGQDGGSHNVRTIRGSSIRRTISIVTKYFSTVVRYYATEQ
jgi:hypothetical protein